MKNLINVLLALSLITSFSCKKEESTSKSYPWVKLGNKLDYDLITDTGTFPLYRRLEVIYNPGTENTQTPILRFVERNIYDTSSTYFWLMDLNYNVYPFKDGLYTSGCPDCSTLTCSGTSTFLRAPNNPVYNQILPYNHCVDVLHKAFRTIAVDTNISVPLGTYNVFVLQDTVNLNKEYWNPDKGLIRLEIFNQTLNRPQWIFVLSRTNY